MGRAVGRLTAAAGGRAGLQPVRVGTGGHSVRDRLVVVGLSVVLIAFCLVGEWAGMWARDGLGLIVPGPQLPVVLIDVPSPSEQSIAAAARAARDAGAEAVWTALPPGHPMLGDVHGDPGTLRAGSDGKIRLDGDKRLPVPEALQALTTLDGAWLSGAPASFLTGRQAVLVYSDSSFGVPAVIPGHAGPVDRGVPLAVALGAAASDGWLRAPGRGWLALGGVVLLLVWWELLTRYDVARGLRASLLLVIGLLVLVLVARWLGFDVSPVVPLLAVVLAIGGRLLLASRYALSALDDVAVGLGIDGDDKGPPSELIGRAEMIALFTPDMTVGAWMKGPGDRPLLKWSTGARHLLPALMRLPDRALREPAWFVVPVVEDDGSVVAAIGVGSEARVPDDVCRLTEVVASGGAQRDTPKGLQADPIRDRVERVGSALRGAMDRARGWEHMIARSPAPIGVFGLDGGEVAVSATLAQLRRREDPVPLVGVLRGASGLPRAEMLAAVRSAYAACAGARIPIPGDRELGIVAFGPPNDRSGFLVEIRDVGAYLRLDRMKSSLLRASAEKLREVIGGMESVERSRAVGMHGRGRLRLASGGGEGHAVTVHHPQALQVLVQQIQLLAGVSPSDDPVSPVPLDDAVRQVMASMPDALRDRVTVDFVHGIAAVRARPNALAEATALLITDAVDHAGAAHVEVRREAGGATLSVTEAWGGLPRHMARRLASERGGEGTIGRVARLLEDMGVELRASAEGSATTGYAVYFEFF